MRRRAFLLRAAGAAGALLMPYARSAHAAWQDYPFSLGVASGYPTPGGAVLWTRLAPSPLAANGGVDEDTVPVRWEVARDDRFRDIAASGTTATEAAWAHSVHLEVDGLAADAWYFYRFHAGDASSATGRLRTAPALQAIPSRLRFACASCQHYEHGFYGAYRHMLADELDLVLHLGDYIYESSWGPVPVRRHEAGEPVTLAQYRARHAHYRSDPDLQAAHAACPWLMVWDDHEVENDYARDRSQDLDPREWFLRRRAAAYQAYYEHMPLPRTMMPAASGMRIHTRLDFGRLARIYMLDGRQYRSYQACPRPGRGGSNTIGNCPERLDPAASYFGLEQERWLERELGRSGAAWNLFGQQTLIAPSDQRPGPGELYRTDSWDGYPAARQRLLDTVAGSGKPNPVFFGGDVHSFWAAALERNFADPASAVAASEFITASIASQPIAAERVAAIRHENQNIRYGATGPRGYLRVECRPQGLQVDMRALADVTDPATTCATLASFVVDKDRPGPQALHT